jgi:hypothetical protein
MIRHCVEESNVDDEMNIIDPNNLDFPDHRVTTCIIAERFEIGASVKMDRDGLVFAIVPRSFHRHYGYLDYTQRLADMISAVKRNQEQSESSRAPRPGTKA